MFMHHVKFLMAFTGAYDNNFIYKVTFLFSLGSCRHFVYSLNNNNKIDLKIYNTALIEQILLETVALINKTKVKIN